MNDISSWYTPRRVYDAEMDWILSTHWHKHLSFIMPQIAKHAVQRIIEWGCGSGLLAKDIPETLVYDGVDANSQFLKLAMTRVKRVYFKFYQGDVRDFQVLHPYDLSMAWNFMKHFSLEQWDGVLFRILETGKNAAFNVQVMDADLDNGVEFHHTFVTEKRVLTVLKKAKHMEVTRQVLGTGVVEGVGPMQDVAFWTQRISKTAKPRDPSCTT